MNRITSLFRLLLPLLLALVLGVAMAWAFAEEPLYFRDPNTGETTDDEISTIHSDLTYVLALAAGFSISDSITLQVWNQLVDSEQLGPGEAISYSNCLGAFSPTPVAGDVCLQPGRYAQVAWPLWSQMKDAASCATSRFGPYSPFFHFPHQNAAEFGSLHDWAWGLTDSLVGYEAYAWGGSTVMQATCRYTRTAVVDSGIAAGSLPAFATYLHALADSYSHRDCIAIMDSLGMPWATHTLTGVAACNYLPSLPHNSDVHGREFGSAYTDSLRTDEAILHLYEESAARSWQREGIYVPLNLDTPLVSLAGAPTLSGALYTFVHIWEWDQPAERRAWADQMAAAILAQRQAKQSLYLPLITAP